MRNILTAMTLTFAALLSLVPAVTWAQGEGVLVERYVSVSPHGLVYVWDSLTKVPIGSSFELGIPGSIYTNLKNLDVYGATLSGQEVRDGQTYYKLLAESGQVVIRHVYSRLVAGGGGDSYTITAPSTPFFTGIDYSSNVFIQLPGGARVQNIPNGFTLNGTTLVQRASKPTTPEPQTVSFSFTSTAVQLIVAEKLSIVYDLDSMTATVWVKVRNEDYRSVTSLSLDLASGLQAIEAGDYSGRIDYRTHGERVTVDIYPSRFEVQSGWRYEFYVKAKIRDPADIATLSGWVVSLKTFLPLNATVENYIVEVILPKAQYPTTADYFAEIYRDNAGRVVARFRDDMTNPYKPEKLVFETTPQGTPPIIPQALILAILFLGVLGFIAYTNTARVKRQKPAPYLDQATAQRLIREFTELRGVLEELDGVASLGKRDIRHAQLQPSISRLKSRYDSLLESLGGVKGEEWVTRITRNLQQGMARVNETLKLLSRSYSELQRGEISRESYLKIYRALRGDIREFISSVSESEDEVRRLLEKR